LRQIPTRIIREFYSNAAYLHSLSANIDKSLANFPPGEEVHLVFSAHSVPVSVIEKGDPYQMQIESTVERLLELGQWRLPHTLCYQSKVGASKWLQPSLHSTLKTLGERRTSNVLVVPVAFVSDHVETLSEINIEAREEAAHHGIRRFELMPGLNDDPSFIRALAGLVLGEAVPLSAKTAGVASS
jgi:ferrochelatase